MAVIRRGGGREPKRFDNGKISYKRIFFCGRTHVAPRLCQDKIKILRYHRRGLRLCVARLDCPDLSEHRQHCRCGDLMSIAQSMSKSKATPIAQWLSKSKASLTTWKYRFSKRLLPGSITVPLLKQTLKQTGIIVLLYRTPAAPTA